MADDETELVDGTPAGSTEPESAEPWLALLKEAERRFEPYNERCDNIDKLYANLERLASVGRDRQMALFWANMQVLQPAIYARPPVPVVMPRFKDRRPVPRTASQLLERTAIVAFETGHIDGALREARNELARLSRGVVWVRYETDGTGQGKRICWDYKFRRDFRHGQARTWAEVPWVAAASYLTRAEMRQRFRRVSGDAYKTADYAVRKDEHGEKVDERRKAKVWELWHKDERKVVWVAEGGQEVLEKADPHLTLDDFFPCPEPAYGTRQPGSLIPVPEVLQYKDQLEEINELTARISALAEAVKVRGFYPAGAGEVGDAIEAAWKQQGDNALLVPVSNWAIFGSGKPADSIIWLPVEMVAATIAQLVSLRQQMMADLYEVSGVSDILRGQTDPNETLGAQELKAQTGSARIKDKQDEMVRLCRDLVRISCEIMAEEFDAQTLLAMSQMELPTDADVKRQIAPLKRQLDAIQSDLEQARNDPQIMAAAQKNPEAAQQVMGQYEQQARQLMGQIEAVGQTVTIEQVMGLLRDQRLRPFVLDIETDSTIAPDENAAKQRATEYVTAMSGLLREVSGAMQVAPQIGPFASEIIKYVNGVFRVGREFEQVVEEFADSIKEAASQPKGPDSAALKAQADAQRGQIDAMKAQADAQRTQADAALAVRELEMREQEAAARAQADAARIEADKWKARLDSVTKIVVARIGAKADLDSASLEGQIAAELGLQDHALEMQRMGAEHTHLADMQANAPKPEAAR